LTNWVNFSLSTEAMGQQRAMRVPYFFHEQMVTVASKR